MLLMTGCSADEVVMETTSGEAVAISFTCDYDDNEENTTRAGYEGVMNTEDLQTTGFGVMASVTAGDAPDYDNIPSLMYNQEVEFTLVGDLENPKKGYWSYQPVKYWPSDLTHCYISAYAPYVEYGTGIFNSGDGLYWVFVKGTPSQGNTSHKRYTLEQAKQIVAMMRAEGLDAYYTNGMPPQPFMHPALERNARQFGQIFDYYARRALSND